MRATRSHDGFPCFCSYLHIASCHSPHARNGVACRGFQSHHNEVKVVSLCPLDLVRNQRAQEHHAIAPLLPLWTVGNWFKMARKCQIVTISSPPNMLAVEAWRHHWGCIRPLYRALGILTLFSALHDGGDAPLRVLPCFL
jgi:hypothetical protein